MSPPEILRTIVTPDGAQTIVELHISDGSPRSADGEPPIALALRVGAYEMPLLAHLQAQTLRAAIEILQQLREQIERGILRDGGIGASVEPRPANPKR